MIAIVSFSLMNISDPLEQTMPTSWPIFVISLTDAHERRSRIAEQCAELGLASEMVDGSDGRAGLPPEFETETDRNATQRRLGRQVTDAEFACALSHRRIYERITCHGLPGAIVLEDDVIISPCFIDFVKGHGHT